MIKVSVIVPTYNREKYVKTCLDSLINQTLKEIEIIVVDDGSSDNTEKIVMNFNDKRIKYIKKENTGIGDTRNHGIREAKGEYLSFVDIDDYIDNTMLEKCYNKAKEDDLDIVICDYKEIEEKTKKETDYTLLNFKNTTLEECPELLNKTNLGPCNKIIKKDLFKNNLFPTDIKYEDIYLIVKLYKESKKIGKINEYLAYFIKHDNSETTIRDNKVFDIYKSLDMIRELINEDIYKEEVETLILSKLTNYNIQQRYQVDRKVRNRFIKESFEYLKKYYPDYKSNKYFKERGIRGIIEKYKSLTMIYCNIFATFR